MLILQFKTGSLTVEDFLTEQVLRLDPSPYAENVFSSRAPVSRNPTVIEENIFFSDIVGKNPSVQSDSTSIGGSADADAWWIAEDAEAECVNNVITITLYPSYTTPAQNANISVVLGGGNPC